MKKAVLLLVAIIGFGTACFPQYTNWKRMRYEFFGGMGITNFMGELGGSTGEASHFFGFKDFEISMTRPAFVGGMRYYIQRRMAWTNTLSYGWLRGDDMLSGDAARRNRNLHFRSPIVEWGSRIEYSVITERRGHRYNLRNVRGRMGNKIDIALFAGGGVFYFNPRGKMGNTWYSLQPLGTEGQNYAETRDPYTRVALCAIGGATMKYIINRKWSVSWEFGWRYTSSDYIDDVSSSYADPNLVAASAKEYKDQARFFADPSDHSKTPPPFSVNAQRGNTNYNDFYMLSFITVNYKVKTGRNGLPRF